MGGRLFAFAYVRCQDYLPIWGEKIFFQRREIFILGIKYFRDNILQYITSLVAGMGRKGLHVRVTDGVTL